jgi:pimeloyl-ACP methyl ester carboxylesterase
MVAEVAYEADGSLVDLRSASRLVILIHGYQNSEFKARRSFAIFRSNLSGTVPREQVWEFHWPGDHPELFTSLATYPVRVPIATQAGEALARFLANHTYARSVVIVAHSLGCRVALETAFRIARDPTYRGPRIEHIFLLAAAVPTALCDRPAKRFPAPIARSAEHVFYSPRDIVLAAGFPKFQAAVGPFEEGEAVGYLGYPDQRWTSRTGVCLAHGKYWGSRKVSRQVATTLTLGTPPAVLPERCLARFPVRVGRTLSKAHLPVRTLFRR